MELCGLDISIPYINGKWKPMLLFHLQHQPRRFGELKRLMVSITEKVLIQQLKELTADGLVQRHDYQELPPKVEYQITEFGKTLVLALRPLCEWGNANRARPSKRTKSNEGSSHALDQANADA